MLTQFIPNMARICRDSLLNFSLIVSVYRNVMLYIFKLKTCIIFLALIIKQTNTMNRKHIFNWLDGMIILMSCARNATSLERHIWYETAPMRLIEIEFQEKITFHVQSLVTSTRKLKRIISINILANAADSIRYTYLWHSKSFMKYSETFLK